MLNIHFKNRDAYWAFMIVDFLKLCSYDVDSFGAVFVKSEIFVLWYASCPKKLLS